MFALDVRSLALMRIAVAASVIVDLITRLVDATAHYADAGVLPREVARSTSWLADTSILAVSGSTAWVALVFSVALGLALAVLVGWRTRLTTLLLWLVVLSIQHRNPLLWDHRDALFACSLLCGLLLPWGDAFSIDARGARPYRYTGAPAALYIIQIACIYLFAALLKTGPEWRSDFSAVEHAVSLEYWARPEARLLLDHPSIAAVLTAAVLGFEFAIAPLLLCPWRATRWLVAGGLCALQLGFAMFLWLDTFPMIAAAMTLGLVLWREPVPMRVERSSGVTWLAVAIMSYVVALNVSSFDLDGSADARRPAAMLGIDQRWTMFAPSPSRVDGWFVMPSQGDDGTIDLLTGKPVAWSRPASLRGGIRTTRELVYLRHLLGASDQAREAFVAAFCDGRRDVAIYFVPIVDGVREDAMLLARRVCYERTFGEL